MPTFQAWTAIFRDPDGNEGERITGTAEVVAEAAHQFILNMICDEERPLACSVEVVPVTVTTPGGIR